MSKLLAHEGENLKVPHMAHLTREVAGGWSGGQRPIQFLAKNEQ